MPIAPGYTMAADSQRWQLFEAVPSLVFSMEGPKAGDALSLAEGRVAHVDRQRVLLEDGVTLSYVLPSRVDLRPLVGHRVRLALTDEMPPSGPRAQTLSLMDETGRSLLTARFGPASHVHSVGSARVRAALSLRPHGPMTFGTDRLQYVVQVGQHVHVRDGREDVVVHFVARTAFDYVAYVISDRSLWTSQKPA